MQITTSQLRAGDRIRGIGLTVVAVGDNGPTATVHGLIGREGDEQFETSIALPSGHRVNVARRFELGDRVTVPAETFGLDTDDFYGPFVAAEVVVIDTVGRYVGVRRDETDPVVWVAFRAARHALPAEATV